MGGGSVLAEFVVTARIEQRHVDRLAHSRGLFADVAASSCSPIEAVTRKRGRWLIICSDSRSWRLPSSHP
jgi:hypothetical protein